MIILLKINTLIKILTKTGFGTGHPTVSYSIPKEILLMKLTFCLLKGVLSCRAFISKARRLSASVSTLRFEIP
ncbi:MAG: hypothetical protein M3R17_11020 [Bacteroidota bacterium]|nr:hypothetical protein [Bacteroidota bacterium]